METKQPTSKYVIPKKPRLGPPPGQEDPGPSIEIPEKGCHINPATSEEKAALIADFSTGSPSDRNIAAEDVWRHMLPTEIFMIKNPRLECFFNIYKKKHNQNRETLGYRLFFDTEEMRRIAENGLKSNSDSLSVIGNPLDGVLLYNSPALAYAGRHLFHNVPVKIMVFRVVKVNKRNEVPFNHGRKIPSGQFECNVLKKPDNNPNTLHKLVMDHIQGSTFYYEFLPKSKKLKKCPSMILPHAVITFRLQPSAQKSQSDKIIRSMMTYKLSPSKFVHKFSLGGKINAGTVLLPPFCGIPPSVLEETGSPKFISANDLESFQALTMLRTPMHFGKLLTCSSVFLFPGTDRRGCAVSYFLLTVPPENKRLLKLLRDKKRGALLWSRRPYKILYLPSGDIATEFGFPYFDDVFHLLIFHSKQGLPVPPVQRRRQIALYIDKQRFPQIRRFEEDFEFRRVPMEEQFPVERSIPIPLPKVPDVLPPGILKTIGRKPRLLVVRWKDYIYEGHTQGPLVQAKTFESDEFPHPISHGGFIEQRKRDEKTEKEKKQRVIEEEQETEKKRQQKNELEKETNNIFKKAILSTHERRISSEEPVPSAQHRSPQQSSSTPLVPVGVPPPGLVTPNLSALLPNFLLPPPISPATQFSRPPPSIPQGQQVSVLPKMNIPPPNLNVPPPNFPNAPVSYPLRNSGPPTDPRLLPRPVGSIPSTFNQPPPTISIPPVFTQPTAEPVLVTPCSSHDDVEETPMDVDDSLDQCDQVFVPPDAATADSKVNPDDLEKVEVEHNDILKYVFTANSKSDVRSGLDSVRNSVPIMKLLEKRTASMESDNHLSRVNLLFKPPAPANTIPTNVLGEDDEDDEVESSSSKDIDYRKKPTSSDVFSKKDRDDRPKDKDERFSEIPLPKATSAEEMRKKFNDQLQGKLRANGKNIDSKVETSVNKQMTQPQPELDRTITSFMFPGLLNATIGIHGVTSVSKTQEKPETTKEPEPEPEPIRSPSPEASVANEDEYIPKTFLNERPKCVTVPRESKEGYQTFHPDKIEARPRSNMENEKSSKKSFFKPVDHDSVRQNKSDQQAKKSWDELMNNKIRAGRLDKEDGEIRTEEDSMASSSTSSSVMEMTAPLNQQGIRLPASFIANPTLPPGITLPRASNNYPSPNVCRIMPADPSSFQPQFNNGRGRGRGRGNHNNYYNQRGGYHNNDQHTYNGPPRPVRNSDWLSNMNRVNDPSTKSISIFVDIESNSLIKPNDLVNLFETLSYLKKEPRLPRVHATVYLHETTKRLMETGTSPLAKYQPAFHRFMNGLVEVIPSHPCDSSCLSRPEDIAECITTIRRHVGSQEAVYLSHNCHPSTNLGHCLAENGIKIYTIPMLSGEIQCFTESP